MGKVVAIIQSCYIPWKGYFDIINMADEFILYDDVQYTRRDWRNRNKIKTPTGIQWLSIPVEVKGKYHQKIKDTLVSDTKWCLKHWETIRHSYSKAKYFKEYHDLFENLYTSMDETRLSYINYIFIREICDILGIQTRISWSMDYILIDGKTERLVDLCKQTNASEYLSGPLARNYVDTSVFEREGIRFRYMDYSGYPEYNQLYPPFEHRVSVIDLIFNEGPYSIKYMKSN